MALALRSNGLMMMNTGALPRKTKTTPSSFSSSSSCSRRTCVSVRAGKFDAELMQTAVSLYAASEGLFANYIQFIMKKRHEMSGLGTFDSESRKIHLMSTT